jgi:hypothetical protein
MVNGGQQKPDATTGARAYSPRRGRRSGNRQGLPRGAGRRSTGVYGLAGLAVLALWGVWSVGVVGCSSPGPGYSRTAEAPGSLFANMRQSPEEISRLERNAHYYKLMGQPELGLKEMELAHQQYPDNLQITDLLAQNYEDLGKFEAARQLYQEALTRLGPHAVLANNLCFSYYREGRWQEAETCFRQTLDRDPGNVSALNNLGLLYCRLGRRDEARRLWQEAGGVAAADAKMSQAMAVLGMPESAVYAQRPEPTPPAAKEAQAPTPKAAVSRLPASAPARPHTPQPIIPKEAAVPVATKPPGPTPTPVVASPRPETRKQTASPQKTLEAKAPGPVPLAAPQPRLAPLTAAERMNTPIEVRNGTWTKDLARQTRTLLHQEGFTVAMIGNHVDFGAAQTVIYYRPEAEKVARAVGATLFPRAGLEPSLKLREGMDIKILLGADLPERPQLMARLVPEDH